jgi:hypothetical protein
MGQQAAEDSVAVIGVQGKLQAFGLHRAGTAQG